MLTFHFLNVGRGDCTIIEHTSEAGSSFGVVDCCTTPSRASPAAEKLRSLGATKLKFACITHPDDDHYTGILDVLTEFETELFVTFPMGRFRSEKPQFKKFLQLFLGAAQGQDSETISRNCHELVKILIEAYKKFSDDGRWQEVVGTYNLLPIGGFGGAKFFGIQPPSQVKGNLNRAVEQRQFGGTFSSNELSAGIAIEYGGRRVVLGSDTTEGNWLSFSRSAARAELSLCSELAKVPHHGSKRDCTSTFANLVFGDATNPHGLNHRLAIVSANGTSHPSQEAMKLLQQANVQTFCTNMPSFFQNAARRLLTDPAKSPELLSLLNLYSEPTSLMPQVCKGDMSFSIAASGEISWRLENDTVCPCDLSRLE